jgi:hypothetical protein
MSPDEIALANRGGRGFADLCDDVRRTRIAHIRAITAREAAEQRVKQLRAAEDAAADLADRATYALDAFIERECSLEGE